MRVLVAEGEPGIVEGLEVIAGATRRDTHRLYRDANVVITQLASRDRAMRLAALHHRPVVHFVHMGRLDPRIALGVPELTVFPARWLEAATSWPGPTMTFRPPIDMARYRTTTGDRITLVNLNALKGGDLFWELARRLPDRRFLAVRGTWGNQIVPPHAPDNVDVVGPLQDIREAFRCTRLLVVPSRQEVFGRIALEACCSGIPVIASDLPGLREALGDAGTFVGRDDLDGWIAAIRSFDDAARYTATSRASEEHARTLDDPERTDRLEDALVQLASRRPISDLARAGEPPGPA